MKITGKLYIPYAKMCSFGVMVPLILAYCKLVDMVQKHVLFYIICGAYGYVAPSPRRAHAYELPSFKCRIGFLVWFLFWLHRTTSFRHICLRFMSTLQPGFVTNLFAIAKTFQRKETWNPTPPLNYNREQPEGRVQTCVGEPCTFHGGKVVQGN